MEITVEKLQERIAAYESDIKKMVSNIHALEGAVQDAKFWVSHLQAEENNGTKTATQQ